MAKILIGESSWDLECFEACIGKTCTSYLHNDFFTSSNVENTKLINRLLTLFKVIYLSLMTIKRKDQLYFSSINYEVLIVAYTMRWYSKSYIFLPNVIGEPSSYSNLFFKVLGKYKERVYVSDQISSSTLKEFSVSDSKVIYNFILPNKINVKNITYIVVLPAALSHNATKNKSNDYYLFSEKIYQKLLKYGLKVLVLPHPRDREYSGDKFGYGNVVKSDEIGNINGEICYISGCSSLSLNRRYGGEYGCWVSIDNETGLVDSLLNEKDNLVEISFFSDEKG